MIKRVRQVEVALSIYSKLADEVELGHHSGNVVAVVALDSVTGDSGNDPRGVNLPNPEIQDVAEVEIAGGIQPQTPGVVQFGLQGWTAIAAITQHPSSSDSGDDAGG